MESYKPKRGFARLGETNPDRQRAIASKAGKAAHASGKAHQYTQEEARLAGQKGGRTTSQNRAHMVAIGRRGGLNKSRFRTAHPHPKGDTDESHDS